MSYNIARKTHAVGGEGTFTGCAQERVWLRLHVRDPVNMYNTQLFVCDCRDKGLAFRVAEHPYNITTLHLTHISPHGLC